MNTKFTLTGKLLIFTILILPLSGLAQFYPGLPAVLGIDGDILSGQSQNISGPSSQGSFDWFRKPGSGTNVGYGVIDTTGTFIYNAQVAAGTNVTFNRGMAYSRYSAVNGYLLLDARYARDNFGYSNSQGNNDLTTYTSGSKNGDNPVSWSTTPNGATVADKADIIDTYIHMRREGTAINNTNPSPLILAMAVNTVGNTGDRYVDFELFKERVVYNPATGAFSNSGPAATGGHSEWQFNANGTIKELGDMEVSFSFGTAGVTEIAIYIWVSQAVYSSLTPTGFNFVSGEFYGASNSPAFGYARIVPKPANPFRTWASVSSGNTNAAPWGTNSKALGGSPTNYYSSQYAANDFAEIAIDFTSLGIDPAQSVGGNPCVPPFTRVMAKTRSSASFTSALQDFTGPYEFLDAPQAPAQIAAPANLKCNVSSVTLSPAVVVPGAIYQWSTSNGNITSNPNATTITVNRVGKYYLTAAIVSGCPTNTDSTNVLGDYFQPVASATVIGAINPSDPTSTVNLQGGDVNLSNFSTPYGGSVGLNWNWTGPNGFTSNFRNPSANQIGTYTLELTEIRNGCKDTANTLVQTNIALPIVLGDFNAVYSNGYTQLKWFTSAEYNTAFFEIERSADGINFTSIGKVSSKGYSNTRVDYGYADILAAKGLNYYRLRSVDVDGKFTYSKVVVVNSEAVGISLLLIYPNPFGHKVQVKVESEKAEEMQIRLINYAGAIVRVQNEKIKKGVNTIVVNNVANLGPGMYELQISTKSKTFSTKIMKQ
jgi:hypothetical protein